MEGANDFAIHNQFNLVNPLRAHDFAFHGERRWVRGPSTTPEGMTGIFAIDCREEHWPRGDKTAPCFQAFDPLLVTEAARQVHVDSAEPQWNRMHSIGCPGGRAQTKTAIQQRVVGQETIQSPFTLAVASASDLHPRRCGHCPVRDGKLSRPMWLLASSNRSGRTSGTSAIDHGQLCFSRSSSAPSACARSAIRLIGSAGKSKTVL